MTAKKAAGHAHKHVASKKHKGTAKHHPSASAKLPGGWKVAPVHSVGKHPHHAKAKAFAVDDWLPVCALEAVAQSLRLAGQPVSGDEVEWLWHLLGEPAEGVPVGEALAAAALFGLAGCRVASAYRVVEGRDVAALDAVRLSGGASWRKERVLRGNHANAERASAFAAAEDLAKFHALILGVDVPGPHAVLATPDGWWSWGKLHDPWPCRIDEAWAVSWS